MKLDGVIGELAGELGLGCVWVVCGPLIERGVVVTDIAAQASAAGRTMLVASRHVDGYTLGIAVCDAGGVDGTFRVMGAGDGLGALLTAPRESGPGVLDLLVIDGAEGLVDHQDDWLAAVRHRARARRTAVVVGVPHLDLAAAEPEMLLGDRLVTVGPVDPTTNLSALNVFRRHSAPARLSAFLGTGPGRIVVGQQR
ncbi:hypothetical protein [Aeromicrobium sp. 50.2.37]|uniref:hypothetical protein n=1 Tax=Aeromicrobium sp. 50.2.37 TaxID=2969305 RepID=UPI00214F869D|nr:hypothetical protein [Aeromicrobium sp. 50.2.37]MCR4511766.1 hypothetical protein [Aeromicrobium sp. 50.2.37]